jgi:Type I restriction enzyme R protein N terminus (HSDR_N)
MVQTFAITEAITTLAEAEQKFRLQRSEDPSFFPEWQQILPGLSALQTTEVEQLRRRYLYHRASGQLLEETVKLLMVGPLLAVAGFYDPPFRIRAEESIQFTCSDRKEVLRGRIDALVVRDGLWVIVVESKKTMLSLWTALPQALAYLMTNPQAAQPSYGLITNGDEMLFVKVLSEPTPAYNLSRVFSPYVAASDLEQVVGILQGLGDRP